MTVPPSNHAMNAAMGRQKRVRRNVVGEKSYEPFFNRREFLKNGAVWFFSMASGCATLDQMVPETAAKDKIKITFTNRTPGVKRRYPIVIYAGQGGRQDFNGHLRRPAGLVGIPGIDYEASAVPPLTEICASSHGVVFAARMDKVSGLGVYIYHGLSYISGYNHLQTLFVKPGEVVSRGAIIGSGGGAGSGGGGGFSHIHFNLFGPVFTPYLQGIIFKPLVNEEYPWRYPANAEQFAIDQSGQLPYLDKGDFALDNPFWQKHIEASNYASAVLKEIGTEEARSLSAVSDSEKRYGVDYRIDARLLYLYELPNKNPSLLSSHDQGVIRAKLIEYMSATPGLTAPIKNDDTPELHKIVRSSPLQTWE